MKKLKYLLMILLGISCILPVQVNAYDSQIDEEKTYILEFDENKSDLLMTTLESNNKVEIKYHYHDFFKGMSIKTDSNTIKEIKKLDGLKEVRESKMVEREGHMFNARKITNIIHATNQNLEKYGADGRGLVIADIDSGIDITHPAMSLDEDNPDVKEKMKIKEISDKGNFTSKVPYGFNYVSGDYNLIDNSPIPHGMHIAGILAGNEKKENGFKGIAPNAQILAYKVFTHKWDKPEEFEYAGSDSVFHAIDELLKEVQM